MTKESTSKRDDIDIPGPGRVYWIPLLAIANSLWIHPYSLASVIGEMIGIELVNENVVYDDDALDRFDSIGDALLAAIAGHDEFWCSNCYTLHGKFPGAKMCPWCDTELTPVDAFFIMVEEGLNANGLN